MNDAVRAFLDAGGPAPLAARSFDAYYFGPLAVVYFTLLFSAALFKPECIRRRWLYRTSLLCFALFLILPCVVEIFNWYLAEVQIVNLANAAPPPLRSALRAEMRAESRATVDALVQILLVLAILTGVGAAGRPCPNVE